MRIVKGLFLAMLFLAALAPMHAAAQAPVTMDRAEVDLWPEYDRAEMLVIRRFALPASVSLPFQMTVRIPKAAGEPLAVAAKQPDGRLFTLPYETQADGDWIDIQFQATTAEVQIEYYDPSLSTQNPQRSYVYTWPGDYAVNSLVLQVQHPVDATNLSISPSLGSGTRSSVDGLLYYTADQGPIATGQQPTVRLEYTKTTDTLSASEVKVEPSAPISDTTTGRFGFSSALPWILGALGVLLIAGGGFWYWRSGREGGRQPEARRRRRAAGPEAEATSAPGGYIYCHQCGKRASPGDRFCRTCGTQLRSS